DLRMVYKKVKLMTMFKVNDWGPFDYYRDFNQTFPLQFTVDLSTAVSMQKFMNMPDTRAGIRWTWRSMDEFSPRYCPTFIIDAAGMSECDPSAPGFDDGQEWEFRTYIHFNIGN
ncbi:MAG: glycosidase, partial [Bacteroidota bacterium]